MADRVVLTDGWRADPHRAVLTDGATRRALTPRQCQILHWAEGGASLTRTAEGLRMSGAEALSHLRPLLDAGLASLCPAPEERAPDRLAALWDEAVRAFGPRPWLIPPDGDAPAVTYAEAAGRVTALAGRLAAAGLRPGDRVAVHAAPGVEPALLFWACGRLGLVFAPLDSAAGVETARRALPLARPALVFADPARAGTVEAAGFPVALFGQEEEADGDAPSAPAGADDVAVILFTSGTTGEPKGVELTQGALVRSARLLADVWGIGPSDRLLSLGEFHTMSGLRNPLIVTAAAGAACVLAGEGERRHPIGAVDLCGRRAVTVLSVVPAFLKMLGGMAGRLEPGSFGPLRLILSTAADLSPELAASVRAIAGAPVLNYYGLTETCGACTLVPPDEAGLAGGSIGRPAGAVCQIVAEDGRVLDDGMVGELRVHGANLMAGYYRRPDLTAAIMRDGWLYTGDLAARRPDGHIMLVGRRRDIVKTPRGDLLALGEVERMLEEDPAVEEAAVIGDRDERGDERTIGFVRLVPGADAAEVTARLKALAVERLGPRAAPRALHVRTEFPRGSNGKVLRHALKEGMP